MKLWDKVKAKLAGKEALADFEQDPEDADAQGALRLQLKKALEADPGSSALASDRDSRLSRMHRGTIWSIAFREEVAALVGELDQKGGRDAISQVANVTGDKNITTQIAGSGNRVG